MNKDLISVIVPAYNCEKTIEKCIDSILNQTYKNLEIVIVNDGSKDRTLEICKKYQKSKKIHIITTKNQGVSSARNTGIKNSNGKYLVFVDSDDYIENNMVEELYKNIENNDLVICDKNIIVNGINGQKDKLKLKKEKYTKQDFLELYNLKIINPPYCKIYLKSIIADNNIFFKENISIGEDLIFNIDYIANIKKTIKVLDKKYYNYVKSSTGLSEKYFQDMFEIKKFISNHLIDTCKNKFVLEEHNLNFINEIALRFVISSLSNEFRNDNNFYKNYLNACRLINSKIFKNEIKKYVKNGTINNFSYFLITSPFFPIYMIYLKISKR